MALDYSKLVDRSFKYIGPKNPLRGLSGPDRTLLFSLLFIYRFEQTMPHRSKALEAAEEMSKIAADSTALAQRIRSVMIEGKFALPLDPFLPGFRDLPSQLDLFGKRLGTLMTHVAGKQGQKHKTTANQLLIMASELVRLKTGEPHDEHLAELLQAISPDAEPGPDTDISGDSIKKKREYMSKTYPAMYSSTISRLHRMASRSSRSD
jgi:hypothetical protein